MQYIKKLLKDENRYEYKYIIQKYNII